MADPSQRAPSPDMLELARAAMARAYAPYSRFAVGAVVRGESGALYAGCNVENAAFPQGSCAEASAISALIMAGERRIIEVLIMGKGPALVPPCGGCRQRLHEFADGANAGAHLRFRWPALHSDLGRPAAAVFWAAESFGIGGPTSPGGGKAGERRNESTAS
jgi:cytidine deaminase